MWMSICPGKGGEDKKCVLTVTKLEGQAGEDKVSYRRRS